MLTKIFENLLNFRKISSKYFQILLNSKFYIFNLKCNFPVITISHEEVIDIFAFSSACRLNFTL